MKKVLITTSSFGVNDRSVIDMLQDAGFTLALNPHGRKLTEAEVIELLLKEQPLALIAGVEPITAKVIQNAGELKIISRCGTGLENIDLHTAHEKGITVLNTPEAPCRAVAELTLGLILAGLRHIVEADAGIRKGQWSRPMGKLLGEQTIGIIGCGRIGSAVARLTGSFGTAVIGYDPFIEVHSTIRLVSLRELLADSDIVSLHLPASKEARHLVNKGFIEKMKPGSLLVNTARGALVDEDALYQAIVAGHLAGACLDTFEAEPYRGSLRELPEVVLTPHIGAYAREARTATEREAVDNLLSAFNIQHKGCFDE